MRLIDWDNVLEWMHRQKETDEQWSMRISIENYVDDMPAVDAEPVRHGLWIWDDEGYHCSECFYHAYGETGEVLSGNWHYCPHCGSRMEEEAET